MITRKQEAIARLEGIMREDFGGRVDDVGLEINMSDPLVDWLREKFVINNESDLYDAIYECVTTYIEM